MSKSYSPHSDTVAFQVIEFFRANPEEVLDREAISVKFGCTQHAVHTILGPAVQAKVLHRKENLADGELMYSLGDIDSLNTIASTPPTTQYLQLQANTNGAWKAVLEFWGNNAEVMHKVEQGVAMLYEASPATSWRIATRESHPTVLRHLGKNTYGIWLDGLRG